MIRKLVLIASVLLVSQSAFAEFVAGIGYFTLEEDDIELAVSAFTLGYEFDSDASNYSTTVELRAGTGVNDDDFQGVMLEVKKFYGLNIRGQWDFVNNTYFYIAPSYTNIEIEASVNGISTSTDEWEMGGGVGVGFNFTEATTLEVSYEKFDGTEVIGLGFRFRF